VRDALTRSLLFFGGKGGVGKTTCAAASALEAARRGRHVLVASVDPAHSVADVFGVSVGPTPTPIVEGVTALEIDPAAEASRYLNEARAHVSHLFSASVVRQAFRQFELASQAPGLEDVAVFELRLLAMPEALADWLHALAARRREMVEDNEATRDNPDADPVLASLQARGARVRAFHQRLTDASAAGFVMVLTPERLPIEETKRAVDALELMGVAIPGVVINRVLPAAVDGEYHAARVRQQRVYLDEIDARFAAYPRLVLPQLESDVHGLPALERIRMLLFHG
jgi:arsenite/tail-anchored protein-transporting ATPase